VNGHLAKRFAVWVLFAMARSVIFVHEGNSPSSSFHSKPKPRDDSEDARVEKNFTNSSLFSVRPALTFPSAQLDG